MSDTIRVNVVEDAPINVNVSGAVNYNNVTNKPSINGVELVGNKTTEELNIVMPNETWELINTITFEEESNVVGFLKDSQGNDYSLKKFRLIFKLNLGASISDGQVRVNNLPSNRNIGSGCYFNYYYSSSNCPCVFETVSSIPGIGTASFNLYGGGCAWKYSQNILYISQYSDLLHYAPFTYVEASWGTNTTGTVELWGIRNDS